MPRKLQIAFALVILGVLVVTPLAYLSYRKVNLRNFRVVDEGVLYRSAQLSTNGLDRLVNDYGIRTVVSMRDGDTASDVDEEIYCGKQGIHFLRLPPLSWGLSKDGVPAQKNVDAFIEVMKDKENYPVLVHCWAGIHRTGQMCAIYRMEFQGWSGEEAIAEMKGLGYTIDHPDVFSYMSGYRPRLPRSGVISGIPVSRAQEAQNSPAP